MLFASIRSVLSEKRLSSELEIRVLAQHFRNQICKHLRSLFRSERFNKQKRNILAALHFKVEQTTFRNYFATFGTFQETTCKLRLAELYANRGSCSVYFCERELRTQNYSCIGALCQSFIIVTREEWHDFYFNFGVASSTH